MIFLMIIGALFIHSTTSEAGSVWAQVAQGEVSCLQTCNRLEMKPIVGGQVRGGRRLAVCAVHSMATFVPGSQLGSRSPCVAAARNRSERSRKNFCLCADDGTRKGRDYLWVKTLAVDRCDTTCKQSPGYPYPAYGGTLNKRWLHVCAGHGGRPGYVGGGRSGCQVANKRSVRVMTTDFACLCTRFYAGDLAAGIDPY